MTPMMPNRLTAMPTSTMTSRAAGRTHDSDARRGDQKADERDDKSYQSHRLLLLNSGKITRHQRRSPASHAESRASASSLRT